MNDLSFVMVKDLLLLLVDFREWLVAERERGFLPVTMEEMVLL